MCGRFFFGLYFDFFVQKRVRWAKIEPCHREGRVLPHCCTVYHFGHIPEGDLDCKLFAGGLALDYQ